eukprot:5286672-Pleurochrysis_carterae.AAC.3
MRAISKPWLTFVEKLQGPLIMMGLIFRPERPYSIISSGPIFGLQRKKAGCACNVPAKQNVPLESGIPFYKENYFVRRRKYVIDYYTLVYIKCCSLLLPDFARNWQCYIRSLLNQQIIHVCLTLNNIDLATRQC